MSKINTEFLKKTIEEMLTTKKQRKYVETVELQIGLRDYDPDKRFNGSVRLPHQAHHRVRVFIYLPRSACSLTLLTSKKQLLSRFHTSMSRDSRPSIRIRTKSKSGLKSTTSCLPVTQSLSRSPSF